MKSRLLLSPALALAAVLAIAFFPRPARAASGTDVFRVWKNTEGVSIEARLVEKKTGSVILEMRNAKRYEVPFAKLSAEDVAWIDGQEAAAAASGLAASGVAFETLMSKPGNLVFADNLSEIGEGWSAGHGEWKIEDGVLLGKELAADNHGATFKRALPLKDAVIQYSFQLAGATATSLSIDNSTGHLCRIHIAPAGFTASKDDNDKDLGPDEGARYNTIEMNLADDEWHTMVIELVGDTVLAQIDGEDDEVSFGSHEMIAGEKAKLGFTITGASVRFKDLKIWEAQPKEEWERTRVKLGRKGK